MTDPSSEKVKFFEEIKGIKIGSTYIWEPEEPKSYDHIKVIEIMQNLDGEIWIKTRGRLGEFWNSEDRFREACQIEGN